MRSESPGGLIRRKLPLDPGARDEFALEDRAVEHYREQMRLAMRAPSGSVVAVAIKRGVAILAS